MNKWKIPFIANIPVEKEVEFDNQIQIEMIYENEKENDIRKAFDNLNSNTRKVGDYLYENLNKELSYKMIAEELGISESTVRGIICDLNFFNGFPITMIPVPKKAGFIQSVLDNDEDYERWDRKKMKTITSMNQVKRKADKIVAPKKREKRKAKEKIINEKQSSG